MHKLEIIVNHRPNLTATLYDALSYSLRQWKVDLSAIAGLRATSDMSSVCVANFPCLDIVSQVKTGSCLCLGVLQLEKYVPHAVLCLLIIKKVYPHYYSEL